jgi:hypothetical protein
MPYDNDNDSDALNLDDYVACTIEGRVVKVVETADGKKLTVKYFDNDGIPRLRTLFSSELELADAVEGEDDIAGHDVVFPVTAAR